MFQQPDTWAVVPIKGVGEPKQRLKGILNLQQRIKLQRLMAEHVLAELRNTELVSKILLVSENHEYEHLLGAGAELFYHYTDDTPGDFNRVLTKATQFAREQGAKTVVIIPADLPMLCAGDIDHLIRTHSSRTNKPHITLVSNRDNSGTNCLASTPPLNLPYLFGQDSFNQHRRLALETKIDFVSLDLPNIKFDVDEPDDLRTYLETGTLDPESKFMLTNQCHTGQEQPLKLCDAAMKNRPHNNLYDPAIFKLADICDAQNLYTSLTEIPLHDLIEISGQLRDSGHDRIISYSKKVFIPLTRLCRDVCHYCTFAQSPGHLESPYLALDKVIEIAEQGQQQGCKEVLFTLGEKPELRYQAARDALNEMGFSSTIEYLLKAAATVYSSTGLLPHINCGCLDAEEMLALRKVSASMGIMLETASERLCEPGGPHYGSPDKTPAARLTTIRLAGEHKVPLTTGILVGIGETRLERIESLLKIKQLHNQFGHIQEIIIQNFCPKPGTRMQNAPALEPDELLWTIATARIIFGASMNIQAPPNLNPDIIQPLIDAGINDWGGISPVTPDFVNPEAPWPQIEKLHEQMQQQGKDLVERLTIYPQYISNHKVWLDPAMTSGTLKLSDSSGYARSDTWSVGGDALPPTLDFNKPDLNIFPSPFRHMVNILENGGELTEDMIVRLFSARDNELAYVCRWANELRESCVGDTVSYVINRNINYTNSCTYHCNFCAFTKGRKYQGFRDRPYLLSIEEIVNRAVEARQVGATEVCLQGGIHPTYTGQTYLDICAAIHNEIPDMHIHAFSPLEVFHGATTLNVSIPEFLGRLQQAGLKTLPGTAAEILDDEIRKQICPDKISSQQWLDVIGSAHDLGLKTTATIMFGHIEGPQHWARHLLKIRDLQQRTGGLTEFVPLPFVHMEAPIYTQKGARKGPTFREAVLMHAVARIVLYPYVTNIQTSWVKMGLSGALTCLQAGANDIGGTLMNESISRAAGATHGQELDVPEMKQLLSRLNRDLVQRDTLYQTVVNDFLNDEFVEPATLLYRDIIIMQADQVTRQYM